MKPRVPTVKIRHPKLAVTVEVPESAVPYHERAGWERVPAEPVRRTVTIKKEAAENGRD
ncbi:hypothetical protein [Nocardiopsis trehalosi]|uniref:hypothetical protein n=1 Tax=Nocardiopsis trehalosi TaxID=109329 RepID=UPI000A9E9B14|nr:hypothetical protein [Nocardiopsis trehalosi]